MRHGILATLCAFGCAAMSLCADVRGATLTVSITNDTVANDGACSLREAITTANSGIASGSAAGECGRGVAPPFDRIDLLAATYRLSRVATHEDNNVGGDLDVRASTLEIRGAGPVLTTLRGDRQERVLDVGDPITPVNLTLRGLTVRDGSDTLGGAIRVRNNATLQLFECALSNNDADVGGAIDAAGALVIDTSTFHANSATDPANIGGGAIHYSGTSIAIVRNATFNANESLTDASFARFDGPATLNNVTVFGNIADADFDGNGDGALVAIAAVHISNSIIASNADLSIVVGGTNNPDCVAAGAALISDGYNLIGNLGAACALAANAGDQLGSAVQILNPKLQPFALYGGILETQPPRADSTAVDQGNPNSAVGAPACEPIDQQGLTRPIGARCDIGASESTDRIFADGFEAP